MHERLNSGQKYTRRLDCNVIRPRDTDQQPKICLTSKV